MGVADVGGVDDGVDQEVLQSASAGEQNLAFVGEVPEKRSLRQAGAVGDLGHSGVLETALAVEGESRLLEPSTCVWLPPAHSAILGDNSS